MALIEVTFHTLVQDLQVCESFQQREDRMVSRIEFALLVDGKAYPDMAVEVQQPHGTDYETEALEVGRPVGPYDGPWNHEAFSDLCERYYRGLVGKGGRAIRIAPGVTDIRMKDNLLRSSMKGSFNVAETGGSAW